MRKRAFIAILITAIFTICIASYHYDRECRAYGYTASLMFTSGVVCTDDIDNGVYEYLRDLKEETITHEHIE